MTHPRNPLRFGIDPDSLDSLSEVGDSEDRPLTREELAWELVEVLDDLSLEEMGELVAKNVPVETLDFFGRYAQEFAEGIPVEKSVRKRLPNLMLLGYLLRVLEDRLLEPETYDA